MTKTILALAVSGAILLAFIPLAVFVSTHSTSSGPAPAGGNLVPESRLKNNNLQDFGAEKFLDIKTLPPLDESKAVKASGDYLGAEPSPFVSPPVLNKGSVSSDWNKQSGKKQYIAPSYLAFGAQPLNLPPVPVSDLNIVPSGARDLLSYLDYFTNHAPDIGFDLKKLHSLPTGPIGLPASPAELVDSAITQGADPGRANAAEIYKEYTSAKIIYLKSIPVFVAASTLNQYMIGADMLTLELLDKLSAFDSGALTKTELQNYFNQYVSTMALYAPIFKGTASALDYGGGNLFQIALRKMESLLLIARAQGLTTPFPFGGLITATVPCLCMSGYVMHLSPGFIDLIAASYSFFIDYGTIASPLLYVYKSPLSGSWILGSYAPVAGPCLDPGLTGCDPIDSFLGKVTFAGTSI